MRAHLFLKKLDLYSGTGQLLRTQVQALRAHGIDATLACERGGLRYFLRTGIKTNRTSVAALRARARDPDTLIVDHNLAIPEADTVFVHNLATDANRFLPAADLRSPIEFGIGIHGGEVIVGDIGYRERTVFTALGDAVNVAARLQDMTKTLDCKVIVSEEVYKTAGVVSDALTRADIAIRGRDQTTAVRTSADPTVLAGLIEALPPTAAKVHQS